MNIKKLTRLYEKDLYHKSLTYWLLDRLQDIESALRYRCEQRDKQRLLSFMKNNHIPTRVVLTNEIIQWSLDSQNGIQSFYQADERHYAGVNARVTGFAKSAKGVPLAELWANGHSFYTRLDFITGRTNDVD